MGYAEYGVLRNVKEKRQQSAERKLLAQKSILAQRIEQVRSAELALEEAVSRYQEERQQTAARARAGLSVGQLCQSRAAVLALAGARDQQRAHTDQVQQQQAIAEQQVAHARQHHQQARIGVEKVQKISERLKRQDALAADRRSEMEQEERLLRIAPLFN